MHCRRVKYLATVQECRLVVSSLARTCANVASLTVEDRLVMVHLLGYVGKKQRRCCFTEAMGQVRKTVYRHTLTTCSGRRKNQDWS